MEETPPRLTGRPSTFNAQIAEDICARVIQSDYGLEQICEAEDMPSARTVYRWLNEAGKPFETFRQNYARAKELQGQVHADKATREALTATDAGLGRLRWDARRWQASKLAPKQYGERTQMEHSGPGGKPMQHEFASLSDAELAQRIASKLAAIGQLVVKS